MRAQPGHGPDPQLSGLNGYLFEELGFHGNDQDYYDQMHLVHDFRAFTGESPSRFLAHIEGLPAFHTFFAVPNRERHETARRASHPYYPYDAAMH